MLMAIADEDPATVRRFVNEHHITLPVLVDRTRSVFDHYVVEGLPKTIILNRGDESWRGRLRFTTKANSGRCRPPPE
jgi:hypothetical protein